jgi:hypothetical protein
MAEKAFEQLATRMRTVFFRPGSKAYGTLTPEPEAPPNLDDLLGEPPAGKGIKAPKPSQFD